LSDPHIRAMFRDDDEGRTYHTGAPTALEHLLPRQLRSEIVTATG
jgi:hypothetical protein